MNLKRLVSVSLFYHSMCLPRMRYTFAQPKSFRYKYYVLNPRLSRAGGRITLITCLSYATVTARQLSLSGIIKAKPFAAILSPSPLRGQLLSG